MDRQRRTPASCPAATGPDLELASAAYELACELPSLVVEETDADPTSRRAIEASLWMGRVWGRRAGFACVGLGHGGHDPAGNGRYRFRRFEERFYAWPADRVRLLTTAVTASPHADVFVGVLLRGRRSRRAGTALPGQVAWADVDGAWDQQRAQALEQLVATTWQVASGTGGRHIYLALVDPEPPERLESINRRLGVLLNADAGWSATKLLRLPGTFNHKPRARGEPSVPVRWIA